MTKKNYIIAIDLGGTNLRTALFGLGYKILDKEVLSTRGFKAKDELIAGIVYSVNRVIKYNKINKIDIAGIGIGVPGPVDAQAGIVHFLPNIPGWREVNLKSILKQKLGLSVLLDNDTKLMSLAEFRMGKARQFRNALCITLGTGIGGGIIIDRKLYRGANNAAGEIGHMPINEKGPVCNCGGVACLEAYAGNNRIRRLAHSVFKRDITLEELSDLAMRGNKKARQVWERVGSQLGVALTGVVNLLNLDAVIVGGGVANAGNILFDAVKKTIISRAMSVQSKHVRVFRAELGGDANIIGAAILVGEAQDKKLSK